MRTVGFLGGYDKTDLMLYIARILVLAKKKVLLVDTSACQKTKYIVPAINPTKTYITEFEGIDVAIGFNNMENIREYLGISEKKKMDYDLVLLDIDSPEMAKSFDIIHNNKNCFVTAFDLYSLKRGMEVLKSISEPIHILKVLFSKDFLKEEEEYLDFLSLGCKVKWDKNTINFPIEMGNYAVTVENQIVSRIKIKRLSEDYKNSLEFIVQMLFPEDISSGTVKKIMKNLEREM